MSPRVRVWTGVAVAAAATAGTAVGVTLATRTNVPHVRGAAAPPLADDPTASAPIVAAVRTALRAWPNGTVRRLRVLTANHPRSGLVHFELGLALARAGDSAGSETAWRDAARADPDSPSAVYAENALHPDTPRGNPPFVPSFTRPATAAQRLLVRGVELQAALRPVSAERAFAAAARLAPNDPEARVAAAVGLYDKDRPALAFSRLGPLVERFPHAQSVRFHLGLLLIYFGQIQAARRQLALAVAQRPESSLARRARVLLKASNR